MLREPVLKVPVVLIIILLVTSLANLFFVLFPTVMITTHGYSSELIVPNIVPLIAICVSILAYILIAYVFSGVHMLSQNKCILLLLAAVLILAITCFVFFHEIGLNCLQTSCD